MRSESGADEMWITYRWTRRIRRLQALPGSRARRHTLRTRGDQRGPGTKPGSRMAEAWSLHEQPASVKQWS